MPLGEENIIFLKSGNVSLELFKAKEDCPIPAPTADGYAFSGLRHLAFAVENVEAKIADMGDDTHLSRLCHNRVGQGVTRLRRKPRSPDRRGMPVSSEAS